MQKIYLASDSKARKKLLNILGIKFKVIPSRYTKEKKAGRSYPDIVKANALNKAKEVSSRIKQGVVIGADTIVVQGDRIYGKPRDLKDARKMLKRLSSNPHCLYTGIAVIDKDNGKVKVSYEKTRVYMDKLTDKQIEDYFSRVSPLDKAGSFDIQGRGAFFIRRIEGCFYNVVGLPLRKLYIMLKSMGIKMFLMVIFICVTFCGCASEYNIVTHEQETYFYSTDKEVQMGESIARQIEKEYKYTDDPLIQKRVEDIGKKIAAVCDRREIRYNFYVIKEEEVNAFALPGGFVYINDGLVEKVDSDDQLAGVIAHEIAHIVARHSIKKLQGVMGYSIVRILTAVSVPSSAGVGNAADAAFAQIITGYSREDELLADQLGARYMNLAGYNPQAMIEFLEKLQEINRKKPLRPKSYFRTHPYIPDRVRVVKQELGQDINFDDYINIQQNPHE